MKWENLKSANPDPDSRPLAVNFKYEKMFSTPVMRFHVPDSDTLNAMLLSEGQALRKADSGVEKSNRGGWHSKGNLFDHDTPGVQRLSHAAREAVLQITRKVTSRIDPADLRLKLFAWMNANPTGGYNAPHTHPGAHWSGVYYVSQPEIDSGTSGMIEFLDPRTDLQHWRILDAAAFKSKKKLRPAAGEMILFPSYLTHWVHPNQSEEERVTVAFNATFRRASAAASS